jgi:hypothetical protein
MDPPEDVLATAERHVREGEKRVARQIVIIEEMDRDNHPEAAAMARVVLVTLQNTLSLMRGTSARSARRAAWIRERQSVPRQGARRGRNHQRRSDH